MALKIAVVYKLGQNVLHKGGDGAGIEAQVVFIDLHKLLGNYHIADTQRGRDGF